MAKVALIYRIDVGFSADRGYGCAVHDVLGQRTKGIRANSIEQLMSRLRNALIENEHKRKAFPLESEPSRIITPDNGF